MKNQHLQSDTMAEAYHATVYALFIMDVSGRFVDAPTVQNAGYVWILKRKLIIWG